MFSGQAKLAVVLGITLLLAARDGFAQRTPLDTGRNIFSMQQDMEMGSVLAEEAERTLQMSTDPGADRYVNGLGRQLADHVPGYRFPFEFRIYIDPAVNSFALPGGMIYVSSGMVQLARSEPELAGALAHQMAHVALRHATQQVSRDLTGGRFNGSATVRDAMSRLDIGFSPDSPVLRYTMAQERQADIIAAQILFDARFDPREMARFFNSIAGHSQHLRSEFIASHPIPNNMAGVVQTELQKLGPLPANLRGDSYGLRTTQDLLRTEVTHPQQAERRSSERNQDPGAFGGFVESARFDRDGPPSPSTRMVIYEGGDMSFRHPDNWYVTMTDGYGITVAPEGGVIGDHVAWGMRIGSYRTRGPGYAGQNSFAVPGLSAANTIAAATDQLLGELRRSNPNMQEVGVREQRTVDGDPALLFQLSNDSPVGGREVNWMVTVLRPNGLLYYVVGVAPESDFDRYSGSFGQIVSSLQFY